MRRPARLQIVLQMSVEHYENFPVASILCPPALRPPIVAIYHFARTADDIADEGTAAREERLARLAQYRAALRRCAAGATPEGPWARVFGELQRAIAQHGLPLHLLEDLLSAFEQDALRTRYDERESAESAQYPDRAALLDYCRRSANPIGRLLLHLYGVHDAKAQAQSDAVCSALQLINFWQDLSIDLPRGRLYVPREDALAHGLNAQQLFERVQSEHSARLVQSLCEWAGALMREGAPLAHRLPGRAGWELRFVVQGGQRILHKIAATGFRTLHHRPRLRASDALPMAWGALRMRA